MEIVVCEHCNGTGIEPDADGLLCQCCNPGMTEWWLYDWGDDEY